MTRLIATGSAASAAIATSLLAYLALFPYYDICFQVAASAKFVAFPWLAFPGLYLLFEFSPLALRIFIVLACICGGALLTTWAYWFSGRTFQKGVHA